MRVCVCVCVCVHIPPKFEGEGSRAFHPVLLEAAAGDGIRYLRAGRVTQLCTHGPPGRVGSRLVQESLLQGYVVLSEVHK